MEPPANSLETLESAMPFPLLRVGILILICVAILVWLFLFSSNKSVLHSRLKSLSGQTDLDGPTIPSPVVISQTRLGRQSSLLQVKWNNGVYLLSLTPSGVDLLDHVDISSNEADSK